MFNRPKDMPSPLSHPVVLEVAEKVGKSPAQVIATGLL
jgi:hypothetical protein